MHVTELAIDAFASYAAQRGEGRLGDTEERARDFVDFLEGWLDLERTPHALLWDMVRHERALAQLARAAPDEPRRGAAGVQLRDGLVFHAMNSDPRAVAVLLREKSPRLDEIALEPCCVCYWREGDEATVVRFDGSMHDLLALVDGERSAAQIHRALFGDEPAPEFLHILGELAELGILMPGPLR